MSILSIIRGAGLFKHGRSTLKNLGVRQPLLLEREPSNPVDKNAIIAKTLFGEPAGYVAREHAAKIAPDLDRGVLWLCATTIPPRIVLYKYEPKKSSKTARKKELIE